MTVEIRCKQTIRLVQNSIITVEHTVYTLRFQCTDCIPCSPPRAAHSHSSSVGSLLPFHWQKAWASFQLTWTTGKPRRSRIPEPGPAGWEAEGQWSRRQEEHAGRCARNTGKQLTCLQNTRSTGSHQGADWTGATSKSVISKSYSHDGRINIYWCPHSL